MATRGNPTLKDRVTDNDRHFRCSFSQIQAPSATLWGCRRFWILEVCLLEVSFKNFLSSCFCPPPPTKIITGPWVPEKQAVLAIWEWLHLWQVWMLLEWQWQVKGLRHTGGKCNNNTRKLHNLSGSTLFIAVMILKITPCKFFFPPLFLFGWCTAHLASIHQTLFV